MRATTANGAQVSDDMAGLRVPPQHIEAEQSVLGGLLRDNSAWDRAAELLVDADFYRHEHRLIFSAIRSLVLANKPADVVTVSERLQAHGKAEDAGGMPYLRALADCVPSAAHMRRYAEIVRERSILRAVIAAADNMTTAAFNPEGRSASSIVDAAASAIGALDRREQRCLPEPVGDLLAAAIDDVQAAADGSGPRAMPTGIGPLDRLLGGGLYPASVYVLAARPGGGKSSAAQTMAVHLAQHGLRTLICSLEMPKAQVMRRLLAELSRVDGMKLKTGQMDRDEWGQFTEGAERLRNLPLHVDDQGGLGLADIRRKARAVKGLQVLVIDYLQLCRSTLKNANTNEQITEISKGIKVLAMELGIAVVLLSQLNRDVERRGSPEPVLSDLRDSGSIEQDADTVMFLWAAQKGEASRLIGWNVAKNRDGPQGASFGMRWAPAINEWGESLEDLRPAKADATSAKRRVEL
jgi:replicative DNA helicase